MENKKYKKSTILYVLKILKEASNKFHPVSQALICRTLNKMGIKCDRKTIARDIDCLKEFGYKIEKKSGGGCYLINEEFTAEDIKKILEGIHSLDIDTDEKVKLNKKVKSLINTYER